MSNEKPSDSSSETTNSVDDAGLKPAAGDNKTELASSTLSSEQAQLFVVEDIAEPGSKSLPWVVGLGFLAYAALCGVVLSLWFALFMVAAPTLLLGIALLFSGKYQQAKRIKLFGSSLIFIALLLTAAGIWLYNQDNQPPIRPSATQMSNDEAPRHASASAKAQDSLTPQMMTPSPSPSESVDGVDPLDPQNPNYDPANPGPVVGVPGAPQEGQAAPGTDSNNGGGQPAPVITDSGGQTNPVEQPGDSGGVIDPGQGETTSDPVTDPTDNVPVDPGSEQTDAGVSGGGGDSYRDYSAPNDGESSYIGQPAIIGEG